MTANVAPEPGIGRTRRPTSTARFGSSRRESHDASAFYERFVAPDLCPDASVARNADIDVIYAADARDMAGVETNSVALVITSPPYFAGKEYEESLGENGVPSTYFEYLAMLRDVFAECVRVLEPGGRIAVNVANLGRRPYRSLAGDVTELLQGLGLLLRGEVVWWKGRAAGGSCAWGSFQRPANPVLRDVTERVVIASKGRFDRALKPVERLKRGLPSTATISREEFMEATTDLWEIAPEQATRVGHPAPFPVALPQRLIDLYTYQDDVVLDPFMGSGSTAVAALRTDRHFIGFDTEPSYVHIANARIAAEAVLASPVGRVRLPAVASVDPDEDASAQAVREGRQAKELAGILLARCGFAEVRAGVALARLGITIDFLAVDQLGGEWAFDVCGAFTATAAGLRRGDTLWRALGRAAVLHEGRPDLRLILLATDLPTPGSAGHAALSAVKGPGRPVADVIELLDPGDHQRLGQHARGDRID